MLYHADCWFLVHIVSSVVALGVLRAECKKASLLTSYLAQLFSARLFPGKFWRSFCALYQCYIYQGGSTPCRKCLTPF